MATLTKATILDSEILLYKLWKGFCCAALSYIVSSVKLIYSTNMFESLLHARHHNSFITAGEDLFNETQLAS